VAPRAIEAVLTETRAVVPINRRTLIALDEAAVSKNVIQLIQRLGLEQQLRRQRVVVGIFQWRWRRRRRQIGGPTVVVHSRSGAGQVD
jgi:hypothetical protein